MFKLHSKENQKYEQNLYEKIWVFEKNSHKNDHGEKKS